MNMKRILQVAITLLVFPSSVLWAEGLNFNSWRPYIGADVQYRDMHTKDGFGSNLYHHNYHPQGNFYLGIRMNDCVGIEGGYEFSRKMSRKTSVSAGTNVLGLIAPTNQKINSTSRVEGIHLSLVGTCPVLEEGNPLKLVGLVGAVRVRAVFKDTITEVNGVAAARDLGPIRKSRIVARLGAGLQYELTNNFAARALVIWENTNELKNLRSSTTNAMAKTKDSMNYSLGLIFKF